MIWKASSQTTGRKSPGTINKVYLGKTTLTLRRDPAKQVSVEHYRYEYRAPSDIKHSLSSHWRLCFDVYVDSSGARRFAPTEPDGHSGYVARAFQIGHSLLARDRSLSRESRDNYLAGKLIFDRMRHAQERIRRRFKTPGDLNAADVPGFSGQPNILPPDIGARGTGRPWSVEKLCRKGREAALADDIARPDGEMVIAYGLLAAALIDPLPLGAGEAEPLVRLALFDLERTADKPSREFDAEVWARFKILVRDHLDDSQDGYWSWYLGGKSNFIKAIANLSGRPLGKLKIAEVRRSLLDHGWRGHLLVAESLGKFARCFEQALVRPLTGEEKSLSEAMYLPQPHFGNLPLPLLLDRSPILKPVILDLWETPGDAQLIGALHQVLRYYYEMVPWRREIDRLKRQGANRRHVNIEKVQLGAMFDQTPVGLLFVLNSVLGHKGACCQHCGAQLSASDNSTQIEPGSAVQIKTVCDTHGTQQLVSVGWEELRRMAGEFADDDDESLFCGDDDEPFGDE